MQRHRTGRGKLRHEWDQSVGVRPGAVGISCLEEWGRGGSAPTVTPGAGQRWLCAIRP